jgi:Flp pilus assembly protein TadG
LDQDVSAPDYPVTGFCPSIELEQHFLTLAFLQGGGTMMGKKMFKNLNKRHFSDSERGQSFVELAVSVTFLLTLMAAVVELAWGFYTMIALRDAATEAATYGAICPDKLDKVEKRFFKSSTAPIDMKDTAFQMCVVDPSAADPNACVTDPEIGFSVRVTVTKQHQILTPFVGSFIGTQTFPLSVVTLNTVLRTTCFE